MKKILIALLCLAVACSSLYAGDRKGIKREQLPQAAQNYLHQNWNNVAIRSVVKETEGYKVEYEVRLANGTTVEFNRDGGWKEIDADCGIPKTALHASIVACAAEHYPGALIVEAEKTTKGYTIELSNGREMEFDTQCVLTKIK